MLGKISRLLILIAITGLILVAPAGAVVPVAAIEITKTPEFQIITIGETVTFTIVVANMGSLLIEDIVVSDPLTPDCSGSLPILTLPAGGGTYAYSCVTGPLTNDLTNTVTVTGNTAAGQVTDSDVVTVEVINPVAITKLPLTQTVENGAAAAFTITVENIGTQTLTGTQVSDPLSPDCDRVLSDLGPGSSTTYTCQSNPVTDEFVNTATVNATYNTIPVSDSDTALVNLPGGGGGGCNTTGPVPGDMVWLDLLWIGLLGGVFVLWRRKNRAGSRL